MNSSTQRGCWQRRSPLIEDPTGDLGLYSVASTGEPPAQLQQWISPAEIPELRGSELAAELAPRVIRAAKAGMRQLTLLPMDARLLVNARNHSVDSIGSRLKDSFRLALQKRPRAHDGRQARHRVARRVDCPSQARVD